MITKSEFNTIKKMIAAYWATLNLGDIRAEAVKKGLLTQNTKLAKGDGSFSAWGLELLPADLNPVQTACPAATGCRYSCLTFSGVGNVLKGPAMLRGAEISNPLMAKTRRSFLLANDRTFFEAVLAIQIQQHKLLAGLEGKDFACRLNVTSDYDWTEFTTKHTDIRFYDYTKVWDRYSTGNWYLTFSASENTPDTKIKAKLQSGACVAVVFQDELPDRFLGYPVIDGDISDARWNDAPGSVVGLKIKATVGGARGKKPSLVKSN